MFKLKKILSLTAVFVLMASCNPKAQTPNPDIPNPKPDPEVITSIPVPQFGNGPIFEVEGIIFDFSKITNPIHTPQATAYLAMNYVPVRAFEQYKEEVLKAGIWQPSSDRKMPSLTIVPYPEANTETINIEDPDESKIFDFTNPDSPQVISPSNTYTLKRNFSYLTVEQWSINDADIIYHNALASEPYKIRLNEEFYVIIVAYVRTDDLTHSIYLPININGLSHSTYMLKE